MNDLLLRAARGERTERPPVWLMRQAGRHLPEYRQLRERYPFREIVSTPDLAARITLQPWERYRPDGLVIFSDILVVLEALGFDYHLESGVGPVIDDPVSGPADIDREASPVDESLAFVGTLLEILDERIGDQVPLIGFAGGPFTLASYAIAGKASRTHLLARRFKVEHPTGFREFLKRIAETVRAHLDFQIASGADIVQLFDTYAGILSPADYREFVLPLHRSILADLDAPSIVFVRDMAGRLDQLAEAGADVIGLDWRVDLANARDRLGPVPVQGNLDPAALFGDPAFVRERTREVIDAAGPAGHILNLGHGVHKDTPVESVDAFVETAKAIDR